MKKLKYMTPFLFAIFLISSAQADVTVKNDTDQNVYVVVLGATKGNDTVRQLAPISVGSQTQQSLHLLQVLNDIKHQINSDSYTKLGITVRNLYGVEVTCIEVEPIDDFRKYLDSLTYLFIVTNQGSNLGCMQGVE